MLRVVGNVGWNLRHQIAAKQLWSPKDVRRYPTWYAGELDPETLGAILAIAENGDLGPLQDVVGRIRGRDAIISGLIETRLSAVAQCQVRVKPNPSDEALSSIVACCFVESWIQNLKLIKRTTKGTEEKGGLSDVLEELAAVWLTGVLPAWIYYEQQTGNDWLVPYGIEVLEARRVRLMPDKETIGLASDNSLTGEPLSDHSRLLWFLMTTQRSGMLLCYAGVGAKIVFPWWLGTLSDENLSKYLDRFGVPIPIGTRPGKSDVDGAFSAEDSASLDTAVQDIHNETLGITIPKAADIKVFSAPIGGEKLFEMVRNDCERRVNYAIVGQTGTNVGTGGSLAKAKVNDLVRCDLIARDRRLVATALMRLAERACWLYFRRKVPSPIIELFDPDEEAEKAAALAAGAAHG